MRKIHLVLGTLLSCWMVNSCLSTTVWSSTNSDSLSPGQELTANRTLASANGQYELIMQGDGNLVEYMEGHALWNTGTAGNPGAWAVMQSDGNLVVYSASSRALWNSGTWSNPGAYLLVQSDANLVVYSAQGTKALWASSTVSNTLFDSTQLNANQYLSSPNRQFQLLMQGDGNLVEYTNNVAIWATGTSGNPGAWVVMQSDGNLVVYSTSSNALWNSGTAEDAGAYLVVGNDGSLIVYSFGGSRIFWEWSLTHSQLPICCQSGNTPAQ